MLVREVEVREMGWQRMVREGGAWVWRGGTQQYLLTPIQHQAMKGVVLKVVTVMVILTTTGYIKLP